MEFFLSYGVLKIIFWCILCFLFSGFAIMDGHVIGVGSLLPFLGKTDEERRVIINAVASHWEGNQVWLISGVGLTFAAFPLIYSTLFSVFYWVIIIALWTLFLRPVGFDYRSKIQDIRWRKFWDFILFLGSFIPSIVFGIIVGNLLQGIPFYFNEQMVSFYLGSFSDFLNPFAIFCGIISSLILIFHGAIYLMHITEDSIYDRSYKVVKFTGILILILFSIAGLIIYYYIPGYHVSSHIDISSYSTPLDKKVIREVGLWLYNYKSPFTIIIPIFAYIGILLAIFFEKYKKTLLSFVFSSIGVSSIVLTVALSMFPFILPSSYGSYTSSLTVWDSVSSKRSLIVMLLVIILFVPMILFYTRWAYKVLSGKITVAYVKKNDKKLY